MGTAPSVNQDPHRTHNTYHTTNIKHQEVKVIIVDPKKMSGTDWSRMGKSVVVT